VLTRRRLGPVIALVLSLGALAAPPAASAADRSGYIVVLREGAGAPRLVAASHGRKYGAAVKHVYRHTISGYSARLRPEDLRALRADPSVAYVVKDGVARIAKERRSGRRGVSISGDTTVSAASWGLDRIDQRSRPLNGTYSYTDTGAGVRAYILDTGVNTSHVEFQGRASHGRDFVDNDGDASDCHGHGTHVAGTVAGRTYGVARNAWVVAVRVLNCEGSGTWGGIIAGLDWVAANAPRPAVANLSLGGSRNQAVDDAVARLTASGVTVVVAAGNSYGNACNYSPAAAPSAITVGATTSGDKRASYSNYGTCLDLFAPGSSIVSAWGTGGNSATRTASGTSMASPHVAGVAALYLEDLPGASPSTVTGAIVAKATTGKLKSTGSGSPNRLLFTDY
jgi:subtilisin family serine protease